MTPPEQSSGVFQALPSSWLCSASRLTVTLPPVVGPEMRTSVLGTPAHAVAVFVTSQIESVPHFGSSFLRFDCVPLVVSTALGDRPVSQNQRSRHGTSPQPEPGSRPARLTHFWRDPTGAP